MAFAPALLPILTIASTGIAVIGAITTANANAQAANYQAAIAEQNQKINEENARRALDRSQQEQLQQDEQTRALLGQQLAAQSASGLRIGGRSQMLTRKSARELGRRDALNVRQAGELEAYNFRVAAADAANSAQFSRMSAKNSQLEGFLNATGSLIGGASNLLGPSSTMFGGTKVPAPRFYGV